MYLLDRVTQYNVAYLPVRVKYGIYAMIPLVKHQSKTKEDSSVLEEGRKHCQIVEGGKRTVEHPIYWQLL